ncbi:MAG: hypothetical protein SOW50_01870, partial [Lachnospiraceae bacterium]|nr:hypothetical protein [Lachnospiraceae bacterium]
TAALMTDALRANLLHCCGYKTQLLEFVDLSHTPQESVDQGSQDKDTGAGQKTVSGGSGKVDGNFPAGSLSVSASEG